MKLYAGVDPGLSGAIALLDSNGRVAAVHDMPLRPGRPGRSTFDHDAIAAIFRRAAAASLPDGLEVTVEELLPMPGKRPRFKGAPEEDMGGGFANYARGAAQGWLFLCAALRVAPLLVLPRVWQHAMLLGLPGDTKAQSVARARSQWPEQRLLMREHGRADALNLAEYGRTRRLGGEVFAKAGG